MDSHSLPPPAGLDRRMLLAGLAALGLGASDAPLATAIAALEARGVTVGMAVRRQGRTIFAHRGTRRFAMCSTFKLPLAAMILSRPDAESARRPVTSADLVDPSPFTASRVGSDASLAELARAAAVLSDNGAANLLLGAIGGPVAFTAWLRRQGDTITRLDRWEPAMSEGTPGDPRDTSTPTAMAALFERLLAGRGIGPAVGQQLRALMLETRTGDAMLRPGLPAGWREGHKTGAGGHGTRNIVSVITPPGGAEVIAAIFTSGGPERLAERDAAFPALARALVTTLDRK